MDAKLMTWNNIEHIVQFMTRNTGHEHTVHASINEIFDEIEDDEGEEAYDASIDCKEEFEYFLELLKPLADGYTSFKARIYFDNDRLSDTIFSILYTLCDAPEIEVHIAEDALYYQFYEPVFEYLNDNKLAYRFEDEETIDIDAVF